MIEGYVCDLCRVAQDDPAYVYLRMDYEYCYTTQEWCKSCHEKFNEWKNKQKEEQP